MNTKTLITLLIVNAVIITIVISTLRVSYKDAVIPDAVKPDAVAQSNYATESVRIVQDENLDLNKNMNEIKQGLSYFSPLVVQQFNEDDWRFIITAELDFANTEYAHRSEAEKASIESLTNTKTKIIQIKAKTGVEGYIRDQTILCMCQYIDYANSYLSSMPEFTDLIVKYPKFVECRYNGVEITDANRKAVEMPRTSNIDYFSHSFRDYLINPEYMQKNYPGLYEYFSTYFPSPR